MESVLSIISDIEKLIEKQIEVVANHQSTYLTDDEAQKLEAVAKTLRHLTEARYFLEQGRFK